MATFLRVDHVNITIPMGREEECAQFYEGVLGLKRAWRPPEIAGPGIWYEMDGYPQLHISYAREASKGEAGDHFATVVDDLEGLRARLTAHDVQTIGPNHMTYDNSERLFCRDPFDNRLEFIYFHK